MWLLKKRSIDDLIEDGWDALHSYNYRKAERIGRKIIRRRHTEGFEILACALAANEKYDEAISELRKGTEVAPDVGVLWHVLGSMLSTNGQLDEALQAYETALRLGPDREAVQYNKALVLAKAGQQAEAIATLAAIDDHEDRFLQLLCHTLKLRCLNEIGKYQDVLEAPLPEELPTTPSGTDSETDVEPESTPYLITSTGYDPEYDPAKTYSQIWLEIAKARKGHGMPAPVCIEAIQKALSHSATNADAHEQMRILQDLRAPGTIFYKLLIAAEETVNHHSGKKQGYFRNYQVAAESPEEALAFAQQNEPQQVHIEECPTDTTSTATSDTLKGIYWVSGKIMYEE